MRTPNSQCLLCKKPLYRRPSDLKKFRYVACIKCRGEAQKVSGITRKQQKALKLGRVKGTNHRDGYKHKESSKRKIRLSHLHYHQENPAAAIKRGKKTRGRNHYNWKGGISNLNQTIRQLTKNRKWMDSIKLRDGECLVCGSKQYLESHHIIPMGILIKKFKIQSVEDAERCHSLWRLENGRTLCRKCHYRIHGRKYED